MPALTIEDVVRGTRGTLVSGDTANFTESYDNKNAASGKTLTPTGTPFQQAVWRELQAIPYGETTSYGALARCIGKPTAFRAVGAANGANPWPIVVPCHRVIRQDGNLAGYRWGLSRKEQLLAQERSTGD